MKTCPAALVQYISDYTFSFIVAHMISVFYQLVVTYRNCNSGPSRRGRYDNNNDNNNSI